jgi:two-component system cell cycle response regulator
MNFNDKQTGERFDSMDLRLAQTCASHAAVVLDRREVYERTAELTRQATTDDLTGLMNRACFLGRMKEELARSERYGKMMSLVMLDIDGFKHINDSAGHAGGDSVLRKVAEIMLDAVRSIDLVGRYGGDEFVIALPETDAFFAMHMAERVRADIAKAEIEAGASDGTANRVTVSMGMATYPLHGRSPGVLLEHADEALYRAKAKGRNRIVVY